MKIFGKYFLLQILLFASFGILLVTVIRMGLIQHRFYLSLAQDNRILTKLIPAARGRILDRKGREVVKSLYLYSDGTVGDFNGYKFEEQNLAYDIKRQYFYGESLGLLTGYLGKINEQEKKKNKCGLKLEADEEIGRGGIEESMDCALRGLDGRRLIEVDAKGKYVRELGRDEPESGVDVVLSIDAYWQEKIYEMVKEKKVVVIISNPKDGKIITMVSTPSINPNYFSFDKDDNIITSYLKDTENLPMMNRAIHGRYHPGSVFKMVVATAGLETGVIDSKTTIEDTGVIEIGDYSYNNWLWTKKRMVDGMVDVLKGLQRSNDIYFYKLGEKLGVDRIKLWAEKFGYGNKTGVELPGEILGIVPDDAWKRKFKGERWFLGNTYHLAIGQGDLDVTPLQVNQMTNVLANNGKKCKMSILKEGKVECVDLKIKKETLSVVKEGMRMACSDGGGTAWPLFNFKTKIACKTGTAEVGDGTKDTHAWLTAYAPVDDPEISITVFVERGGEGSDEAAPIVGDILKEWFGEEETVVPRK
jgi:penicillin-binding protein 2